MSANKSALVAGMGVAMSIVQTLVAEIKKAGGKEEDIHRLATPDASDLWCEIAKVIVKKEQELVESINQLFSLVVRYEASYFCSVPHRWDNIAYPIGELTINGTWQHVPVEHNEKSEQEITLKLFPCKFRGTISEDVIKVMEQEGYRPAILQELLAFGQFKPALQRRYKIAALGSILRLRGHGRQAPLLQGSNSWREVTLRDFDKTWDNAEYLFLGVGKPVEVVTILVLGPELHDWQEHAIRDMFPGKRLNYIYVNLADGPHYVRICEHYKPGMVIVPGDIPLFVMKQDIPHVIVSSEGYQRPIHTTELLSLELELKPYVPQVEIQ